MAQAEAEITRLIFIPLRDEYGDIMIIPCGILWTGISIQNIQS